MGRSPASMTAAELLEAGAAERVAPSLASEQKRRIRVAMIAISAVAVALACTVVVLSSKTDPAPVAEGEHWLEDGRASLNVPRGPDADAEEGASWGGSSSPGALLQQCWGSSAGAWGRGARDEADVPGARAAGAHVRG